MLAIAYGLVVFHRASAEVSHLRMRARGFTRRCWRLKNRRTHQPLSSCQLSYIGDSSVPFRNRTIFFLSDWEYIQPRRSEKRTLPHPCSYGACSPVSHITRLWQSTLSRVDPAYPDLHIVGRMLGQLGDLALLQMATELSRVAAVGG